MAETALLGVAKFVLKQLSSLAMNEFLLVWNFKEDLNRLGETIEMITCFIHDAEQRQSKELAIKLWLSRLKVVLYQADDLVDTIAARALRKKSVGGGAVKKEVTLFFSKSNHLAFVIKTAHDIKAIRGRLDGIKDDMSSFQFQYRVIEEKRSRSVLEREERHSFVDHKDVIGRDQEKEDIITLLLSEDPKQQNLEVISVIGFGGLGKTTLAQLVYNDERVQKGFDLCLWSCINYLSDLELVLVKILKSKSNDLHLDELQEKLRNKIQEKKYLLVLDDVWDENTSNWGRLETLLNCGKIGSKVLITTRKTRVAQCLDAIEPYYRLNIMSEESAWSLFVKMTFKDGKFTGDSDLVLVGKQILQKCGYVPLAISTIGRMLRYRKKNKEEWLSFLEKEFAEIISDDSDDGNLMQVLKVGYNDLPLALKHCFAYCSVFPKDHEFGKDELVRMWLAQSFIEPHAKKSLEEVGDDYFFHLVDRCFFQEVQEYSESMGGLKHTCKMHDLIHDLAIQVAESEYICYSTEDSRDMAERSSSPHHISVTCSTDGSFDNSKLSSLSKSLRTLRLIDAKNIEINSLELVMDRFIKLRTLVLSEVLRCTTLPDSFGGLVHLRYLDLSNNYNLITLPNSICKLYQLQTLLLDGCSNLVRLPSNLTKLVSLRHLFMERCWMLDSMPLGFGALTSLVSLDRLVVHPKCGGLRYLGRLDELCGMLTLYLPENGWTDPIEDARKANMSNKCRLSGLSIEWKFGSYYWKLTEKLTEQERKAILDELQPHADLQYLKMGSYTGYKLPNWFSMLSNIKELALDRCSLEFLDISVRCGYLLPRLESLRLDSMQRLRGWWSVEESPIEDAPVSTMLTLPRVSSLVITKCRNLVENMPSFMVVEDLQLKYVNVRLVNMLLRYSDVQCSSRLRVLVLNDIEGLECLPESLIKHLTALKIFSIFNCWSLRWVSRRGLAGLTSLEELSIICSQRVRLEDEDDDDKKVPYTNYGLESVRKLVVPWQSHLLEEGLQFLTSLQDLSIEYFEEQQVEEDNQDLECERALRWQGLEKLQQVTLRFKGMYCCFPSWVLQLPCVRDLTLRNCGEMDVDDWVSQQTLSNSLVSLTIHPLREVEPLWVHDIPWKLLPSLRVFSIDVRLSRIPDGIQFLSSLESLSFYGLWINNIPKWMINLTSLQRLRLGYCSPELVFRCEPETGADWHLISHIPTIMVYKYNGFLHTDVEDEE